MKELKKTRKSKKLKKNKREFIRPKHFNSQLLKICQHEKSKIESISGEKYFMNYKSITNAQPANSQ